MQKTRGLQELGGLRAAKPAPVEMHELDIRVESGAISASDFHVAPSSINRGMFQRTLRIERSLPRATPYIPLSEFALAITDMAPPICSDPGTPCFDGLALDADDSMPFGEMTSSLATIYSGLRPAIALPWATGVSVRLSPLRIGTFYPGGYLPPEQIRSVVRQNFDRMQDCYADARRRNPKLTGLVRVQFKIDLEGKVLEASEAPNPSADAGAHAQSGSTVPLIRDPKMVSCVLSEFAKLQFARPERAGSLVRYDMVQCCRWSRLEPKHACVHEQRPAARTPSRAQPHPHEKNRHGPEMMCSSRCPSFL